MQLTLITNNDDSKIALYKTARIFFAETETLCGAELIASMIRNICLKTHRDISDIINDKNVFECLDSSSIRNEHLSIRADDARFLMCLRVARRLFNGQINDMVFGATKFHRSDNLPQWAMQIGAILEKDNLCFYE